MASSSLLEIITAVLRIIRGWFQYLLLSTLARGPIPNHIAFIMDGNRRYARTRGKKGHEGHAPGVKALRNVSLHIIFLRKHLHQCNLSQAIEFLVGQLGVKTLTAYLFSIDNFNRTPIEVETLMDLWHEELLGFLDVET